jgi:hypothetical protein
MPRASWMMKSIRAPAGVYLIYYYKVPNLLHARASRESSRRHNRHTKINVWVQWHGREGIQFKRPTFATEASLELSKVLQLS